jgi:hypothetical protein
MAALGIRSGKLSVSVRMEAEKLAKYYACNIPLSSISTVGMQECNNTAINLKFYD